MKLVRHHSSNFSSSPRNFPVVQVAREHALHLSHCFHTRGEKEDEVKWWEKKCCVVGKVFFFRFLPRRPLLAGSSSWPAPPHTVTFLKRKCSNYCSTEALHGKTQAAALKPCTHTCCRTQTLHGIHKLQDSGCNMGCAGRGKRRKL